jgi:hypothetical protein
LKTINSWMLCLCKYLDGIIMYVCIAHSLVHHKCPDKLTGMRNIVYNLYIVHTYWKTEIIYNCIAAMCHFSKRLYHTDANSDHRRISLFCWKSNLFRFINQNFLTDRFSIKFFPIITIFFVIACIVVCIGITLFYSSVVIVVVLYVNEI